MYLIDPTRNETKETRGESRKKLGVESRQYRHNQHKRTFRPNQGNENKGGKKCLPNNRLSNPLKNQKQRSRKRGNGCDSSGSSERKRRKGRRGKRGGGRREGS